MNPQPSQDPIEELLTHVEWVDRHPEIKLTATLVHAKSAIPAIRALQARCKELEAKLSWFEDNRVPKEPLEWKLHHGSMTEIAAVNQNMADYAKHWEGRAEKAEAKLARVINAGGTLWSLLEMEYDESKKELQNWRKAIAE